MSAAIAIVEDDAERAVALGRCLDSSPELHLAASYLSAIAALKSIPRKPPSLILVDFRLVDMPGVECVRRLHLLLPRHLSIVFNAESELRWLFDALRAGAAGYLDHRVPFEEIPTYVHVVLHGGLALPRNVGYALAAASQQWEDLTERESEIASRLLMGKRQKEVAADLGISVRTLETHLWRLYHKHGVHSWKVLVQKTPPLDSKPRPVIRGVRTL